MFGKAGRLMITFTMTTPVYYALQDKKSGGQKGKPLPVVNGCACKK
jgi:hypothetical protein